MNYCKDRLRFSSYSSCICYLCWSRSWSRSRNSEIILALAPAKKADSGLSSHPFAFFSVFPFSLFSFFNSALELTWHFCYLFKCFLELTKNICRWQLYAKHKHVNKNYKKTWSKLPCRIQYSNTKTRTSLYIWIRWSGLLKYFDPLQ